MMQPRSPQYCFSLRTISWNEKDDMILCGFKNRERDELTFDLRFHLLRQETPQIGGGRMIPCPLRQLPDRRMQNLFGDCARLRSQFPGPAQIESAATIVAIKPGALAAEISALGLLQILQPG